MGGRTSGAWEGLAPLIGRARQPGSLTLLLTGVVATAGLAFAAAAPERAFLQTPTGYASGFVVLALGVAFFLTELGQARIEFRQQAYSFSLSGIPMLLGLLYAAPHQLVLARLVAAVMAFALQRVPPMKFAYNTAAYLLDTALVLALSHLLLGGSGSVGLTPRTAVLLYLSLAAVDLLMSSMVLLLIHINDGPLRRAEAAEMLLSAAVLVALNTAVGFLCAVLLDAGLLGGILLVLFVVITTVVYRGYLVLRRRHQSLELVQRFIEHSEGAGTVDELASRLLGEIRTLMRASVVELTLRDEGGNIDVRVRSDGHPPHAAAATAERLATVGAYCDGLPAGAGLISAKSTDPAHSRWLREHGVGDAAVVPLTRSGASGTLIAVDRLGDATSFTTDDLALLQALAGHLTMALRNTALVARLRHDATHDALTGLPNRTLLTDRLAAALVDTSPGCSPAVVLMDLNRFKEVNDTLGHHVGDQLLQVVATRLTAVAEPGATVSRLGGDEFAVLLPRTASESDAVRVAERSVLALRAAVELPDATLSTEASIGVAFAAPGLTAADVLSHADTAMYAAKLTSTAITIYTPDLDAGRAERRALLADLHLALERDELELHYQPKLDLAFDTVTSVEALVRWTHPRLGPVAPDAFIPLAESTGLIDQLTDVVLAKALRQCRMWQDEGLDLGVAVNLSARNVLDPRLPDKVTAALVAAGLPARKLILEITESSVLGDPDRTIPTLARLADLGVVLSLDDFGTGYSSLSYLQQLPVRELKIDQSFVAGLTREGDKKASEILVRAIIGLGSSLGLRIVAEGVETAEVLSQLRGLGCDIIQGYQVGHPVPGCELREALTRAGLRTLRAA